MTEEIHTCHYFCERPECVRRQRDELRDGSVSISKMSIQIWDLTDQLAALKQQREGREQDAKRYRWIRDSSIADTRILGVGKRSGAQLDAAIDAAIAAAPSEGEKG